MKTTVIALFAVFIAAILVLGCTGAEKTDDIEENGETITPEEPTDIADQQERTLYQCPLDTSKITYDCNVDADCKLVSCRSGAGDVDTCMGVDTDYEGVSSEQCFCKVTGSYEQLSEEGDVTTAEIKECRHI